MMTAETHQKGLCLWGQSLINSGVFQIVKVTEMIGSIYPFAQDPFSNLTFQKTTRYSNRPQITGELTSLDKNHITCLAANWTICTMVWCVSDWIMEMLPFHTIPNFLLEWIWKIPSWFLEFVFFWAWSTFGLATSRAERVILRHAYTCKYTYIYIYK